jgi:hypothetical protein
LEGRQKSIFLRKRERRSYRFAARLEALSYEPIELLSALSMRGSRAQSSFASLTDSVELDLITGSSITPRMRN